VAIIVFFFRNNAIGPYTAEHNASLYQQQLRSKEKQLTITIALILANYTVSWTIPSAIWFAFNVSIKSLDSCQFQH
jgi:hypothetical protein